MEKFITIKAGTHVFNFRGQSRGTRHGFAHDAFLSWYDVTDANSYNIRRATCHHLNRTWENFPFQTAFIKAVRAEQSDYIDDARRDWLDARGYKNMNAARRAAFTAAIEQDATARMFAAVMDALETCGGQNMDATAAA